MTMSEHDSMTLLAEHGIRGSGQRLAVDAAGAVAAAREIGYPVAVKLCGTGVAHKTERGLVRLGVRDDATVAEAAAELLAAARPDDRVQGVLVAPMVRGTRELIAGVHRDPQFGPCVMIGMGGVLAEAIADVTFRLVPITEVDAEEMLDDLATQALLGAFRGEPPVDRAEVVALLVGLSRLAENRPDVVSVDVNPLIIVDGRPVAVDALVVTADPVGAPGTAGTPGTAGRA
jgi:acetate---CoA ligase (ADP-forming) subunit beta